ncbi:DUF2637 domain-containing protein [Streptomyces aureus]|uniref:DUF2637 domain-containing protein n=2 Tax=Streptomyces aureus TaxID=193461 RepID=UPI0036B3A7BA
MVVAGALIIAGIGFAGSYAAVRELALKKGFGNFSYVFPIGIDAGIGVLLALDLLLTWIRIPFPMLRQTAWLLTMATIAFNGAAAWPDPLGVGMHAVIPVLFVVAVEAARHAIGRIADITADKHMEGVRLTRWLLSPVPTFLLWRRMKLWELRSYSRVIKLEQERLVYQARLHSRFGRAWRRKAPVESLMPLRLARYGVPLAETASAGLAAAGIGAFMTSDNGSTPDVPQPSPQASGRIPAIDGVEERLGLPMPTREASSSTTAPSRRNGKADGRHNEANGTFAEAYRTWLRRFQMQPTLSQFAAFLQDQYAITTAAGHPLPDEQLSPILQSLQERYAAPGEITGPQASSRTPAGGRTEGEREWEEFLYLACQDYRQERGGYPDAEQLTAYAHQDDAVTIAARQALADVDIASLVAEFRQRDLGSTVPGPTRQPDAEVSRTAPASLQESRVEPATVHATDNRQAEKNSLTTVDRYYVAWADYRAQYGLEPKDRQLSIFLAEKHGMLGREGQLISPSTLRRYLPGFRIYAAWSVLRERHEHPSAQDVAHECAARKVLIRKTPVTAEMIEPDLASFQRRWQAIRADPDRGAAHS